MKVLVAIRDRMLSWAGHVARMEYEEICGKALRCRGLQWWRWRQLHWKEKDPKRSKICRWEDMVSAQVPKFTGNTDGFSESVRAGNSLRNLGRALFERRQMPQGPKCVWHGVDCCWWEESWSRPHKGVAERGTGSERFG